jgi:hypothetical protein
MSKFAIGEQVENAAGDQALGTVAAGFPAVGERFGRADIEGYGARGFFTELAFSPAGWEAA